MEALEDDATLPFIHNIYGGFKEKKVRVFENYCPTIRTGCGGGHIPSIRTHDESRVTKVIQGYQIRQLTPLECFRLMGFSDEDYTKIASKGFSNSRMYKFAGNSIVVPVLKEIFKKLYA